jgi:hypothetical protein
MSDQTKDENIAVDENKIEKSEVVESVSDTIVDEPSKEVPVEEVKTKKSRKTKKEEKVEEKEEALPEINEDEGECEPEKEDPQTIETEPLGKKDVEVSVVPATEEVSKLENNTGTKLFYFHKDEAKAFCLNSSENGKLTNGFVRFIAYCRYTIAFFRADDSIDPDYYDKLIVDISRHLESNISMIISKIKAKDIIFSDINSEQINLLIPYTSRLNIVRSNITQVVNQYMHSEVRDGIKYKIMTSPIVKFIVNPLDADKSSFAKGFTVASKREYGNGKKVFFNNKSGVFVSQDVGFDRNDIFDLNKFILSSTKVNIFGDKDVNNNNYEYMLSVKSGFNIFQYEFVDLNGDEFVVNTMMSKVWFKFAMIFSSLVPIGIYISSEEQTKTIKSMEELYSDTKGNNIIESTMDMPKNSIDLNTLRIDLNNITKDVLKLLGVDLEKKA